MAELLAALSSSLPVMAILTVIARILDGLKAKMAGICYSAQQRHCHWIFIATWLAHECWLSISLIVCVCTASVSFCSSHTSRGGGFTARFPVKGQRAASETLQNEKLQLEV